jgi:hypothetical protein
MGQRIKFAFAFALTSAFGVACGGSVGAGTDAGVDTGIVVDTDAGTDAMDEPPVEVFPADFPGPPRVISSGGPVLKNFTVIPVFFPNDPLQAQVEQFLKAVPMSNYWAETTKEYGATDFTVADSIVVPTAPATSIDNTEIQTWLGAQTDGTHMGWPSSNDQTLFALFYPQTTTITLDKSPSCQSFGAYHDSANSLGTDFPYAVMPRCGGGLDSLTVSTSHELVEAATDPLPRVKPAYQRVDNDHIVWSLAGGGETGDMCEFDRTASQRLVGNFMVQRSWSNNSIKLGHDPCVPVLPGAFFAAVPVLTDNVKLTYQRQSFTTKGVKIPLGQSATIDVKLFSDAPKDTWTVSAQDRTSGFGSAGYVTFSWDKTTGRNGDVLQLTINAVKQSPMGGAIIGITSQDGSTPVVRHRWLGAVGF